MLALTSAESDKHIHRSPGGVRASVRPIERNNYPSCMRRVRAADLPAIQRRGRDISRDVRKLIGIVLLLAIDACGEGSATSPTP